MSRIYPGFMEWCEMHGCELDTLDDCYYCDYIHSCSTYAGRQFSLILNNLKQDGVDVSNILTMAQLMEIKGLCVNMPYIPYTRPSEGIMEWLYRESKKSLVSLIEWFPIWRRISIGQE